MNDRELMQQALEALENNPDVQECDQYWHEHRQAITALRERLAQPEQEPVAVQMFRTPGCSDWYDGVPDQHEPGQHEVRTLYTTPQPRQWQGLTDEEIIEFFQTHVDTGSLISFASGAEYAEAKLREKNT